MAAKYIVDVSDRARATLKSHVVFLARVSVPAAKRLSAEFRKAVNNLKISPLRYPYVEEGGFPPKLYRKCLFFDRYELIFVIRGQDVHIEAVHDCRQNPNTIADISS